MCLFFYSFTFFKITIPKGVEYTVRAEKEGFHSEVVEVRYEPDATRAYMDRYTIYIRPDQLSASTEEGNLVKESPAAMAVLTSGSSVDRR